MKSMINVDDHYVDDDHDQERGKDRKDWEKLVWVSEALHQEGAEQLVTCNHDHPHDEDYDQVDEDKDDSTQCYEER